MTNVLVTGGTGFIGSHLVDRLGTQGCNVSCLVRQNGKAAHLEAAGARLITGDVTDKDSLQNAFRGIDIVYHLAAAQEARHYPEQKYWDINVQGTRNVLEECQRHGVPRFVHCSSVGIYGPSNQPVDEDSPYNSNPTSVYHKTKLEAEKIVRKFLAEGEIEVTIIRPVAIVFGPRDFSNVLGLFRMIKKRLFVVIGKGDNVIHQVYVEDLVRGITLAGEDKKAAGETYILGDSKPATISELAHTIAKALGVGIPRWHLPVSGAKAAALGIEALAKVAGFSPPLSRTRVDTLTQTRRYDTSKAKRELGFENTISLEEGISRTANWYEVHGYL